KPLAKDNVESMRGVMKLHHAAVEDIQPSEDFGYLKDAARDCWEAALSKGDQNGYRNAQVTVLAPTGTIAFLMDCDTTGIEPDIALVKYKLLAGGGTLKIVNRTVPDALSRLGYSADEVKNIVAHIEEFDSIEDVKEDGETRRSGLKPEHLDVFDCAFKPFRGERSIHYMAHLKMMAAAQPFISGAISKTVNLPRECSVADITDAYTEAWKLGLKCVAIYRDGSKRSQPLNTAKTGEGTERELTITADERIKELEDQLVGLQKQIDQPLRRRLPETRQAVTHKFDIAGHEGYLTIGLFEDGTPGEMFITMAKEGSTIGGLMDSVAALTSVSLQYGVPLAALVRKFSHQRFEPSGFTKNPQIRRASSIIDYVFRWMGIQFIPGYLERTVGDTSQQELNIPGLQQAEAQHVNKPVVELPVASGGDGESVDHAAAHSHSHDASAISQSVAHFMEDAPACTACGHLTVRNGACFKCLNCGESLGCS
ncbi:uncharacterized protein METZ01_LOCUS163417, partial [marine metagenome]